MSSLLSKTSLALWVWIVIIVVGSLVVLGSLAFLTRLFIIRRRQADFVDTFGDENLPQRRVTVRRGRVVEQSKYLSLTGSKFGLNAFAPEDSDALSRAGARSKSPFEWWSTLKDRSQSRNSQITQMTVTNETSSIYGPTSPGLQKVYQRKDFNYSSTSLASTSKEDDATVSIVESQPSPPAVVRNFSRSFSRQGYHSGHLPMQKTLSRIEESSPHTSMMSMRQSRAASYASNRRDTKSDTPSPLPHSPSVVEEFPRPPQSIHRDQARSKTNSVQYESDFEAMPRQIEAPQPAYAGSRSIYGQDWRPSFSASKLSLATSTQDDRGPNRVTALPEAPSEPSSPKYWDSKSEGKSEGGPSRSNSLKKGKVLRKKSLKKMENASRADF